MLSRLSLPPGVERLSVLACAEKGCLTYYVGSDVDHVAHLRNCALVVGPEFEGGLPEEWGVHLIRTSSAKEAFYRLSAEFKEDYLETERLQFVDGVWVHPEAKLGSGVQLAPGAVIGKCVLGDGVSIGPHAVIYAKTRIGNGTSIGASTVVGTAGMMWVWGGPDGREKVFLEQLGSVTIGAGCRIGSNISIVRGNANEATVLEDGVCVAHGSMIGHGSRLGRNVHLANNVSLGGGVVLEEGAFLGSGSVVSPGKSLAAGCILGAGSTLVSNGDKLGVYVGAPARWKGEVKQKMSGVPEWKRAEDVKNDSSPPGL